MPIKVCFVALNAYPAIDPHVPGSFGGIETRSWLFARELAKHADFEVSFLVRHGKNLRAPSYEGVKLYLLRDRFYAARDSLLSRIQRVKSFPWVLIRQPRFSDVVYLPLFAAMKVLRRQRDACQTDSFLTGIEADMFLTFGVQSHSATVIASARAANRRCSLFLGSDGDLDENYLPGRDFVSVYRDRGEICYWTIQNADQILVQTVGQQERLSSLFERNGVLIQNPIDVERWDQLIDQDVPADLRGGLEKYVLWVGRADAVHKRPQVLIELAKRCPDVNFLMVMNPRDDLVDAAVRRSAPDNVAIVSHVPFSLMPGLFRQAVALVNTSSLEGFPNTYLQAAISRVPIVSMNVEAEFLHNSHGGVFTGGDLEQTSQAIQNFWNQSSSQAAEAELAREYVRMHHGLTSQTEKLAEALLELLSQRE